MHDCPRKLSKEPETTQGRETRRRMEALNVNVREPVKWPSRRSCGRRRPKLAKQKQGKRRRETETGRWRRKKRDERRKQRRRRQRKDNNNASPVQSFFPLSLDPSFRPYQTARTSGKSLSILAHFASTEHLGFIPIPVADANLVGHSGEYKGRTVASAASLADFQPIQHQALPPKRRLYRMYAELIMSA